MVSRVQAVHDLIVKLADSVGADSEQQDLPQILADGVDVVFNADAAVLLDEAGTLTVAAVHGAAAAQLVAIEVDVGQGPSMDCFRDGIPVTCVDPAAQTARWPRWQAGAQAAGVTAVHARPLRRRRQRIGVLALLVIGEPSPLGRSQLSTAQALADAATVGILNQRLLRRQALVTAQLRFALESRVLIEQAKGMLAERTGTDVEQSFRLLRRYARNNGRKIHEVAQEVISGSLRIPIDRT